MGRPVFGIDTNRTTILLNQQISANNNSSKYFQTRRHERHELTIGGFALKYIEFDFTLTFRSIYDFPHTVVSDLIF
jgi:hypothetical protein